MKAMASPSASLGLLVLLCIGLCPSESRLLESAEVYMREGQRWIIIGEPKPPASYCANNDLELGLPRRVLQGSDSHVSPPSPSSDKTDQELGLAGLVSELLIPSPPPGIDSPVQPPPPGIDSPVQPPLPGIGSPVQPPPPGSDLANTDLELGLTGPWPPSSDSNLELGLPRLRP